MPYVKHIRVNVPKRSGFDKSHRNSGTLTCGTLTPILCDELVPNSRVSLRLNLAAQLPPLVSDTYMNCKLRVEAFFTPLRLLCASFEDFFCDFPKRIFYTSAAGSVAGNFAEVKAALPVFQLSGAASVPASIYQAGTLLDYLGCKIDTIGASSSLTINPLPLVNYHLLWQEYYRNPRVQNPPFAPDLGAVAFSGTAQFKRIPCLPFAYFHRGYLSQGGTAVPDNTVITVGASNLSDFNLADGTSIFALRQRNFGLDYFTGSRVSAQQGAPSSISFTTNVTGTDDGSGNVTGTGSGSVTIAAIRASNSLQQFRERNNLPSPRLVDQVKGRYNANLADGIAQRPIVIGSAVYDLSSRGIDQTAGDSNGANPFNSVASQYGRAYGVGSDFIINDFTANEPGYIMVLLSVVPDVTYSTGINPVFKRYLTEGSITDMACSLLQNVGDQPILARELAGDYVTAGENTVFGFTDRYADYMFKPNECHGLFRDGQSLQSFVLQRSFGSVLPQLSNSFLQIPKTYLDGVFAVSSGVSGVSAWYDCMLDYKVSMPLAEYSIPSLQDPAYEHGEKVVLRRNGQIF